MDEDGITRREIRSGIISEDGDYGGDLPTPGFFKKDINLTLDGSIPDIYNRITWRYPDNIRNTLDGFRIHRAVASNPGLGPVIARLPNTAMEFRDRDIRGLDFAELRYTVVAVRREAESSKSEEKDLSKNLLPPLIHGIAVSQTGSIVVGPFENTSGAVLDRLQLSIERKPGLDKDRNEVDVFTKVYDGLFAPFIDGVFEDPNVKPDPDRPKEYQYRANVRTGRENRSMFSNVVSITIQPRASGPENEVIDPTRGNPSEPPEKHFDFSALGGGSGGKDCLMAVEVKTSKGSLFISILLALCFALTQGRV